MSKKYYYKAMDKDMKCRGFQFKLGETYTIESEELELCSNKVFHFCERLEDTIDYYNNPTDRHFLIEVLGAVVTEYDKSGSNKIRIVREISREEIEEHIQNINSLNAKTFIALYSPNIEILEILAKDEYGKVRRAVAENPNTPVYLLETLTKDKNENVRYYVAKNVNTPIYSLEYLSKDEDWEVLEVVAKNPNTPAHILEELAKDEIYYVREAVAYNPNTPVSILEEFIKSETWVIRCAIAESTTIPVYILEILSKDILWCIRKAVAENPNTSVYILEHLAKDKDIDVRKEAQKRLKEITQ